MPAPCQVAARGNLDHRNLGQAIRRAAPGGEDVQVDAGRQLQRAANEVAGRRGGVDQPFLTNFFARRQYAVDGIAAGFDDGAHGFLDDVGQTALLVARRGVGAAIHAALLQVLVVPGHFADHGLRDFGRRSAGG